jgi:uncharacterized membrane protein YraQ (UPF0718 family)
MYCGRLVKESMEQRAVSNEQVEEEVAAFSRGQDMLAQAKDLRRAQHRRKAWPWRAATYPLRILRYLSMIVAVGCWLGWFKQVKRGAMGTVLIAAVVATLLAVLFGAALSVCKARFEGSEE